MIILSDERRSVCPISQRNAYRDHKVLSRLNSTGSVGECEFSNCRSLLLRPLAHCAKKVEVMEFDRPVANLLRRLHLTCGLLGLLLGYHDDSNLKQLIAKR